MINLNESKIVQKFRLFPSKYLLNPCKWRKIKNICPKAKNIKHVYTKSKLAIRNSPNTKEKIPAFIYLLSYSLINIEESITNFDKIATKMNAKELRRLIGLISGILWLIESVKIRYQFTPIVIPATNAMIIKVILI